MSQFSFGSHDQFDLGDQISVPAAASQVPIGTPLTDIVAGTQAALSEPVEFPPLSQIVLPDDTVVIVLQSGLPCAAELVAGAIHAVMDAGVPAELIRILRDPADAGVTDRQLLRCLDANLVARLTIVWHDASDREKLSFLGASKEDNAIYVSREICDAGFVLPIGYHGAQRGIHLSWFPAFADAESQQRFYEAMASHSEEQIARQLAECEEVGWMTGIQFVLQMVPGRNAQAMHVVAGLPQAVWQKCQERHASAWTIAVPQPVRLAIAGIGGGAEQQTWENVSSTVERLLDAVEVDGAIAICSQLKAKPGPAMRRLAGADGFEMAELAIEKMGTRDALAASRLNRALQRVRVYLLSDLREADVEDLGVAYVADIKEISKLASQFESQLVVENAQHIYIAREED